MRKVLFFVLCALIVLLVCSSSMAQVFPNVGALKWAQPPHMIGEYQGFPVFWGWDQPSYDPIPPPSMRVLRLADDWYCGTPDPVSDIHWWGSYNGWLERVPPGVKPIAFNIWICKDVPVGPNNPFPYSYPGEPVWHYYAQNVPEIFVGYDQDPRSGQIDSCFRYDVILPTSNWFFQDPQQNHIYWLVIAPVYPPTIIDIPNPWGWKTRPHYFMDFAVKEISEEPGWTPILEGWDLAFRLTTPTGIKWNQEPERKGEYQQWPLFYGWDEPAWVIEPSTPKQAADDWLCVKPRPVTAIEWWGSYVDWLEPMPPIMPNSFWFGIYKDVPAGVDAPYSHPGEMIWQYTARDYIWQFAGYDTVDRMPPFVLGDSCFKYKVKIPRSAWFWQETGDNIYWLSIKAQFPDIPAYEWGWKTRPHFFNDDGVYAAQDPYGTGWSEIIGPDEKSWDLAFQLRSFPRISVTVELKDYIGDLSIWPVTVRLIPLGGTIPRIITTTLSSNPQTIYFDDVEPDIYNIEVECMPHWLRKIDFGRVVADEDIIVSIPLTNGDCSGDNGVDEIDYALLSNAWYQAAGDPKYDINADLNGDGGVDEIDYAILSNAWYTAGD